jgi:hypothetical protein
MALADLQRQAQLGGQVQQYAANDVGALSTAGGQQQALTQQNLTAANNDWQSQNNWQRGNLDWLSQIIRGLPAQQSTTQSVTQVPTAGTQISPLAAAAQGFAGSRALASPITAGQAPVPR